LASKLSKSSWFPFLPEPLMSQKTLKLISELLHVGEMKIRIKSSNSYNKNNLGRGFAPQ